VTVAIDPVTGFPSGGAMVAVERMDTVQNPKPHALDRKEPAAAALNWAAEIAANPALFDGRMVFQHRLALRDGIVCGEGYVVPYSTFLWWRRQLLGEGGFHVFGFPVIASADGALIAVKMAAHTANPGQVYCAAGSLDTDDIVDGYCDLAGNMRREVREETGLDLDEATTDGRLFAGYANRRLTIVRLFRFDVSAETRLARIAAHMEVDEEKEIAEAIAIRRFAACAADMPEPCARSSSARPTPRMTSERSTVTSPSSNSATVSVIFARAVSSAPDSGPSSAPASNSIAVPTPMKLSSAGSV